MTNAETAVLTPTLRLISSQRTGLMKMSERGMFRSGITGDDSRQAEMLSSLVVWRLCRTIIIVVNSSK